MTTKDDIENGIASYEAKHTEGSKAIAITRMQLAISLLAIILSIFGAALAAVTYVYSLDKKEAILEAKVDVLKEYGSTAAQTAVVLATAASSKAETINTVITMKLTAMESAITDLKAATNELRVSTNATNKMVEQHILKTDSKP